MYFYVIDVLAGLLDLPDEINDVGAGPFQVTPPTNNIDQQPLDISTAHQAPPNMVTPPLNNIGSNMGSPSPSNMGGAQLNSHMHVLGNNYMCVFVNFNISFKFYNVYKHLPVQYTCIFFTR